MGCVSRGAVAAFVVVVSASGVFAAVPFSDSWDGGTALGWVADTPTGGLIVQGSSGNPGGMLESTDGGTEGRAGIVTSKAAATGDYAGLGQLSVDVRLRSGSFQLSADHIGDPGFLGFRIMGAGDAVHGWYYILDNLAVTDAAFTSFVAPFDPTWTDLDAIANGWEPEDGLAPLWTSVLGNVESVGVRATGAPLNTFAVLYDNFALTVPNAGTMALLGCATILSVPRRRRGK